MLLAIILSSGIGEIHSLSENELVRKEGHKYKSWHLNGTFCII